jgi:hypothetical protein
VSGFGYLSHMLRLATISMLNDALLQTAGKFAFA